MMKRSNLYLAMLASATMSPPVLAQNSGSSVIEEVSVTAERRSQSLQEIPLAISSVSGEKVEKALITRTTDLSARSPGLQVSRGRLGEPKVVIRGIGGSVIDNIAASPKVAMFIDDVYVSRGSGMDMTLFDIERIEVLRGPQGTLYGKNAIGGAINIVSRAPTDEFEAKANVTAGNYNELSTRLMVGGPLANKFSGKVLLGSKKRDGFTKNLTTGNDLSVEENYFGRATLRYELEDWDLRASVDYERNPQNPGTAMHIGGSTGYDVLNLGGAVGTVVFSPADRYEVTNDIDGEQSQSSLGVSFKESYQGDDISFDSITAYREVENTYVRDTDQSPNSEAFDLSPLGIPTFAPLEIVLGAQEESWTTSQEFRFSSAEAGSYSLNGRLFWTTGLFLLHDEGSRIEPLFVNLLVEPQIQSLELEGDTAALYGQATYSLRDDLDLIAGLRYSYDTKKALHNTMNPYTLFFGNEAFTDVEIEKSWTSFTPKLTGNYRISEDVSTYATFSRGTLGGGFNFGPTTAEDAQTLSFDKELADNYEMGLKVSTFDGRLTYSLAAFYIDYQDLQVQSISSSGTTTTANAATATSHGLELEATLYATDALKIDLNYAYIDATFDEFCEEAITDGSLKGEACIADGGLDNSGNQLQFTSEHTYNAFVDYLIAETDVGSFTANLSYSYFSERYFGPDNTAGQGGYSLIDTNLSFDSIDGKWSAAFWGKNLRGEEYNVDFQRYGSTADGAAYVQGAPRTYGLTVAWNY